MREKKTEACLESLTCLKNCSLHCEMSLNCYRVDFFEIIMLLFAENALNRVSTTSSFLENTENKLR